MKIGNREAPYSFSQNRLYNDCPRKYKFRYVDGILEPTNENLELGSAVHRVFETYYTGIDEAAKEIIINLKGFLYYNQLCKEFEQLEQVKPEYNIGRELRIERDDFVSVIDLANNYSQKRMIIHLADYKVTKKPKTINSIYDEGQLLVYKYLYCKEHPEVNPNDVYVQYINILPYLSSKIISTTEPQMVSFETCENLFNQIAATKEKILNGEFPKKKTWCKWCHYREICQKED